MTGNMVLSLILGCKKTKKQEICNNAKMWKYSIFCVKCVKVVIFIYKMFIFAVEYQIL